MYICVIRLGVIYGLGEECCLFWILKMVRMGLLKFCIGGLNVLIDWVYVDNLVYVYLLVSMVFIDDLLGRLGFFFVVG